MSELVLPSLCGRLDGRVRCVAFAALRDALNAAIRSLRSRSGISVFDRYLPMAPGVW